MKIINNTGYVVTVFNSNFNKDIAIGESLIITDEELYGNFELCFKYFFVKKSEVNEEWKWVSGARGGHYSYSYNKITNAPTVTKVNSYGINEITLEKSETNVNAIMFKSMCVRSILLKENNKAIKEQAVSFCDAKIRKRVMGIMFMKLIMLFLLSAALAIVAFTVEVTTDMALNILVVSLAFFIWWLYTLRVLIKIKKYK